MRTPPKAFTAWEFIRGALLAFGYWLVLYLPSMAVVGVLQVAREAGSSYMSGVYYSPGRGAIRIDDFWPNAWWAIADAPMTAVAFIPYTVGGAIVALVSYGWVLALVVGLLLRRRTALWGHRLAFAGVGAVVGFATPYLVLFAVLGFHQDPYAMWLFGWPYGVAFCVSTAIAVVLGWSTTHGLAMRRDRRVAPAATDPGARSPR